MKNTDTKVLVHLGFPKTASTWLQNNLFCVEDSFACPWGVRAAKAIDHFVLQSSFTFSGQETKREFEKDLALYKYQKPNVALISEETLIGDICADKYWGYETIRRVKETFPEAKILLCIREQRDIIYSAYGEYIRGGGTRNIRDFFQQVDGRPGFGPICRPDALLFDSIIECLYENFGEDSVLVLPMEQIRQSPQLFVDAILSFLNIEQPNFSVSQERSHVGLGAAVLSFARVANFIYLHKSKQWQRGLRLLSRILPRSIHDREAKKRMQIIKNGLEDYYCKSNRSTSSLISVDLKSLGYMV